MLYGLVQAQEQLVGISVAVVLFNDGILARKLREVGIELHIVPESTLGVGRLINATRKIIRRISPDVVHTHRLKEDIIGALATIMTGANCRVRTVHGVDESNLTPMRAVVRILHRAIVRHRFALTIAVSRSLAQCTAKVVDDRKVRYIPNGLDTATISAVPDTAARNDDSAIAVGIVGRLVSVKRVDVFLRAAALATTSATNRFEFRVYGEGPKERELLELADELGLQRVVRFMGFTQDITEAMQQLDLLCLTSDSEGLPMVVLEAMAIGVPVIASAVGDIPEVLENGACGTLIESGESARFAEEIVRFSIAPEHFLSKCERAAQRVRQAYSAQACAHKYIESYQDAIEWSVGRRRRQ